MPTITLFLSHTHTPIRINKMSKYLFFLSLTVQLQTLTWSLNQSKLLHSLRHPLTRKNSHLGISPALSQTLHLTHTIFLSFSLSLSIRASNLLSTREMQVHKHEQNGPKKVGKYEDEGDGGIAKEYKWYFFLFCINLTDRNGLFWNLDKVEKILFECQTRTRFCKQKYQCKFMFRAL